MENSAVLPAETVEEEGKKKALTIFGYDVRYFIIGMIIFSFFGFCAENAGRMAVQHIFDSRHQILPFLFAYGVALLFAETQLHMQRFLPLYIFIIAVLIIPIIVTTLLIHKPSVTGFACIVFLSVSVYHIGDASPYAYALNRLLDTVIGIIVALCINLAMPGAAPMAPPEGGAAPKP